MATSRPWCRPRRRGRWATCHNRVDASSGHRLEVLSLDIIFLLERLESLVATGTGVPATRKVLVDRDAILDLVDQLRVAIPEEVQAAKRINAESERILEKAGAEGQRIVSRAQEQAAFLISERGLADAAYDESRRIVAAAEKSADDVRRGADDYSLELLEALEKEMDQALSGIRKGLAVLEDRRAELQAAEAAALAVTATSEHGRMTGGEQVEMDDDDEESPAFVREGDAGARSDGG